MALITHPLPVDLLQAARRIQSWFDIKGFETKAVEHSGMYCLRARKASAFRAFLGADRALEVAFRISNNQTEIDVRQGSWKTNVVSNAIWLVATGGMNLAFSGWSFMLQKELESHIREVLQQLSGAREIDLRRIDVAAEPRVEPRAPSVVAIEASRADSAVSDVVGPAALLKQAQDLHFGKQFSEAIDLYNQLVSRYPDTKQAGTARQQLANLTKSQ